MDKRVNIAMVIKLIKPIAFNRGENESQKKTVPNASVLEIILLSFVMYVLFGT